MFLTLALIASSASAAECTDTWTGPAEGTWKTAGSWSTGKVPTETDVACIGSGKTVSITESANKVTSLKSEGTLKITGGSLEITGTAEASTSNKLVLKNATLKGPATVNISKELSWEENGIMAGTGKTVLLSGATGTVKKASITERTLVNEGTLTAPHPGGEFEMANGAKLENIGNFRPNGEETTHGSLIYSGSGAAPLIVNKGTIEKATANSPNFNTKVGVALENFGTVEVPASGGTLEFISGVTSSEGTWGKGIRLSAGTFSLSKDTVTGTLFITGATGLGEGLTGSTGTLSLTKGSLSVPSGKTDSIGTLKLQGGTLAGAGTFEVHTELKWTAEGVMEGSGKTIVQSGASGEVTKVSIAERTLINEGTLTEPTSGGGLEMSKGAQLENKGTYVDNQEHEPISIHQGEGSTASFINRGTLRKSNAAFPEFASKISVKLENYGHVENTATPAGDLVFQGGGSSSGGTLSHVELESGTWSLVNDSISGPVYLTGGPTVTAQGLSGGGSLSVFSGSLTVPAEATDSVQTLKLTGGTVTGAGTFEVPGELYWSGGAMSGSGNTVIGSSGKGKFETGALALSERRLVNEGTITVSHFSELEMAQGAKLENKGTLVVNGEKETHGSDIYVGGGAAPTLINRGALEKTSAAAPNYRGKIGVNVESSGTIYEKEGNLTIEHPVSEPATHQQHKSCSGGDPVECSTGNFSETQTDFEIGGRGVGLDLVRTYSAQAAAKASSPGAFGYGWTSSFSDHLTSEEEGKAITLSQADGGTVPFTKSGVSWVAPAWSQDALSGSSEAGYTLTLPEQTKYKFSSAGRLESVADRNGNETTLGYNESSQLETITDPASRKITLTYNGEGLVEKAKDPMGHEVKYTYESNSLKTVTLPEEASANWQFKYDGSHRMTSITDGRGGKTTNEYDASSRVISQTDPASRTTTFEYASFHTKITNKATGAVTDEWFTSGNEPFSVTHGFGTASATTNTFTYNAEGQLLSKTDGNGHKTTYGYDEHGNLTSETDAAEDQRKWTYNEAHEVLTETTPEGEKTTITRDGNGNPEIVSRPAPEEETQTSTLEYGPHGELEGVTDPLERTTSFEYNANGDLKAEINPEGDKQTWAYNEDSRVTSMVSPRGNEEGAEAAKFRTTVERNAQDRPTEVISPLGNATKYTYDANGNPQTLTNANGKKTTFTYNADDERTKVERPNGNVSETGYDGAGQVTSQTNGNKRTTTYVRNVLEQVKEIIDPLERKTALEYDAAGNVKSKTDSTKRKTSFLHDAVNRLKETTYSDGVTPTAAFSYNKDGRLKSMTDGTGESVYSYDQLGRLIETKAGHGETVGYKYNLDSEPTELIYPNGKAVSQVFNGADQLEKVTDWLGNTTSFAYNRDSRVKSITFPVGTGNVDEYAYDRTDLMSEVKMKKGAETLASLGYTRTKLGQIEKVTSKGLPGAEEISFEYDLNSRMTKAGGGSYEYDAANNLLKAPGSTYAYDKASQLETGTGTTYAYDAMGERTKLTPAEGPVTTYKYDQAENLIAAERTKEGETPAISESYTYDGNGLRASQTVSGVTSHLTWDLALSGLSQILSDGSLSYIYGPNGVPIEHISSEETPSYYHQDQLGSTRLLTNGSGEAVGTFTFSPYGKLEGSTGAATTPIGFAGQYSNQQSGFQYVRARVYDPATGQFLTSDPLNAVTHAPYSYAYGDPVQYFDPSGYCGESISIGPISVSPPIVGEATCAAETAGNAAETAGSVLPTPRQAAEIYVGVFDGGTLGLTSWLRGVLGIGNGGLDLCGPLYDWSQVAGAAALSILAPELGPVIADRALLIAAKYPEATTWIVTHQEELVQLAEAAGELASVLLK